MKQLIAVLLGSFLLISGCGSAGTKNIAEGNNEENNSVKEDDKLEMTSEILVEDDKVIFKMGLTNNLEEKAEVSFSSGQQYEIVVTNEKGEEVYRYSDGQFFTQAIVSKQINPGESLNWEDKWNFPKDKEMDGEYKVKLTLLPSKYNNNSIEKEQFSVNRSFTIDGK